MLEGWRITWNAYSYREQGFRARPDPSPTFVPPLLPSPVTGDHS